MNVGPYTASWQALLSLWLNPADSIKVRLLGIPRLPGHTATEIAKNVLRANARDVLIAGTGHFRFMWISDFAKALRGARSVLSPGYLRGQIELMVRASTRLGQVATCYTFDGGFDMPYPRGDGLPWLLYAAEEWTRWTADKGMLNANRPALQKLLETWEATQFEDGLISPRITGDWMDSLMRPSSTYNNVCALMALRLVPALGLKSELSADVFEKRLLERRWRGDHFVDYDGVEDLSVDAAVFALYFGLFSEEVRRAMARNLEASALADPYPIRCAPRDYDKAIMPPFTKLTPRYHSVVWLHLGLMYLNGLKSLGRDVRPQLKKIEELIMRYRNVLETIDVDGKPYSTLLHSTEHGLSMAAGQYLELVA